MQFDGLAENAADALVLDAGGRSLGIVTTVAQIKNQNIAVPLSKILGLINAAPVSNFVRDLFRLSLVLTHLSKRFVRICAVAKCFGGQGKSF